MPRERLEVADIFRAHGAAWRKARSGQGSLGQLKVMSAIEQCRTAALGGDVAACQAAITRAEMIMEQDPPLLPVAWEKINDGWYDYVKGHRPKNYFGLYNVGRFDTFWMDK